MTLRAGRLNRRIRIERLSEGDDGHGGQARTWAELARDVPVAGAPIGGKEALQAGSLHLSQSWRLEMRPRDVTNLDRIVPLGWKGMPVGTILNIRAVNDVDGRGESLVLLCDTGPAA